MRTIMDEIKLVTTMNNKELEEFSMNNNAPLNVLKKVQELVNYQFQISVQEGSQLL